MAQLQQYWTLIAPLLHSFALGDRNVNFGVEVWSCIERRTLKKVYNATVTIPDKALAVRFLGSVTLYPPLRLRQSHRNPPRAQLVNHLLRTAYLDPVEEQAQQVALAKLGSPISISAVEFGQLCSDGVYLPEYEWKTPCATLTFDGTNRRLLVKQTQTSSTRVMAIHIASITRMFYVANSPSLLLLLSHPPRFEDIDRSHSSTGFDFSSLLTALEIPALNNSTQLSNIRLPSLG